ncbi:MAG TPA: hypothetical protein PKC13_25935, partial [Blastocatellia bacterium]|nr:hypothetical protein [Blastocatellia bacterium]
MKRKLIVLIVALVLLPVVGGKGQGIGSAELRAANDAWNNGKYSDALREYLRLLNSPAGDQVVESIARQTGEVFHTDELTADGRTPRLSPDGSLVIYETGSAPNIVTRLVAVAGNHLVVAEVPAVSVAVSPSGKKAAYLKVSPNDELKKAQAIVDDPATTFATRLAATQNVNWLQAKLGVIVVRDLATRQETELPTGNLLKSSLVFGADNETIYFVGAREGETNRNDIYAVKPASQPVVMTEADGFKTAPVVGASGKTLLVTIPLTNPFPPLRKLESGNADTQGQRPQGGGGGGGPQAAATKFGLVDLSTRKMTAVNGTAFTLSADGSAVTYLTRSPQENALYVLPIGGEPVAVLKTADRLDTPAFSPDGQQLVYSRMTKDDWELFVIGRDGKIETRLTREIQHDILPRFLTKDRLIGMIGEPRHRRAYLYDLATNTRTQLFHNNTVRTISPEYVWTPTPDGEKVLIQADRDGNTVSPERGVYLVNLDRKVTKAELIARLEKQLASETALAGEGRRVFAPIAADVRKALEQASVNRIYEHEKNLFDFDSKHISRPGNKLAIEYLTSAYKSFGYEPEQQWFELRQALGGKTANVVA